MVGTFTEPFRKLIGTNLIILLALVLMSSCLENGSGVPAQRKPFDQQRLKTQAALNDFQIIENTDNEIRCFEFLENLSSLNTRWQEIRFDFNHRIRDSNSEDIGGISPQFSQQKNYWISYRDFNLEFDNETTSLQFTYLSNNSKPTSVKEYEFLGANQSGHCLFDGEHTGGLDAIQGVVQLSLEIPSNTNMQSLHHQKTFYGKVRVDLYDGITRFGNLTLTK